MPARPITTEIVAAMETAMAARWFLPSWPAMIVSIVPLPTMAMLATKMGPARRMSAANDVLGGVSVVMRG
jgi:hypothetical protein